RLEDASSRDLAEFRQSVAEDIDENHCAALRGREAHEGPQARDRRERDPRSSSSWLTCTRVSTRSRSTIATSGTKYVVVVIEFTHTRHQRCVRSENRAHHQLGRRCVRIHAQPGADWPPYRAADRSDAADQPPANAPSGGRAGGGGARGVDRQSSASAIEAGAPHAQGCCALP